MSNTSSTSNKVNVPEARAALEQFKYEVANEIGVPLKKGYNGDLTSAQNGYVGGYMVKKMIEAQEKMMAEKKITHVVKLQIQAGKANPAPPVGPALGPTGINIMQFCKDFNEKTAKDAGMVFPVVLTVYADKTFEYVLKTPPAAVLLKQAAKIEKASGKPHKEKVGKVTVAQVEEIAKIKMKDLNASSLESAVSIIKGTARSMGIEVIG